MKKKKFLVTLNFVQYSTAEVEIIANSQEEAEQKADEMQSDGLSFREVDGELTVESVEEVK